MKSTTVRNKEPDTFLRILFVENTLIFYKQFTQQFLY